MSNVIKLPKETLQDILWESDQVIEDTIEEHSRWSVLHNLIFKHEGKCYQTHYSVGATEYQDERPWEYEDEVECTEVKQVEVTVKKWVAVE